MHSADELPSKPASGDAVDRTPSAAQVERHLAEIHARFAVQAELRLQRHKETLHQAQLAETAHAQACEIAQALNDANRRLDAADRRLAEIEHSTAYAAGLLLVDATRSLRGLLGLPWALVRLWRARRSGENPHADVLRAAPISPAPLLSQREEDQLATLKAIFADHGLAAAESHVRLSVADPAERAQQLLWLGRRLAASLPGEAARLGAEARRERSDPELDKWLLFRLFDAGELAAALDLLGSIPAGSLKTAGEQRKATLVRQLGALRQDLPTAVAAGSPISFDEGSVLYLEPRCAGWSGQTASAQAEAFAEALLAAGARRVTSLRLENLIASGDASLPARSSEPLGAHGAERVVLHLGGADDAIGERIHAAASAIATEATRARAGLIHATRPLLPALAARLAADMLGVAFVYDATDVDDGALETAAEGSTLQALAADVESAVVRDASLVLLRDRMGMRRSRRLGAPPARSMVVRKVAPVIAVAAERRKGRASLRLTDSDFLVGCLDMATPDRDVLLAFAEMHHAHPEARLLLAGAASAIGPLRRLAADLPAPDRIVFKQTATPAESRQWLAACDAMVLPGTAGPDREMPLALAAMARGIALVAPRDALPLAMSGKSAVARPYGTGSPRELAAALSDLLRSRKRRTSLAARGEAWVADHCNPASHARLLVDALYPGALRGTLEHLLRPFAHDGKPNQQSIDRAFEQIAETMGSRALLAALDYLVVGQDPRFEGLCRMGAASALAWHGDVDAVMQQIDLAVARHPEPVVLRPAIRLCLRIGKPVQAAAAAQLLQVLGVPSGKDRRLIAMARSADAAFPAQALARTKMFPYENLFNLPLDDTNAMASQLVDEGWQLSQYPVVPLSGPIPWEDGTDEYRSWNYHIHCLDMLDGLLLAHSTTGETRWLRVALQIAMDWVEKHPDPQQPGQSRFAWYDMAVGKRAYRLAYIADASQRLGLIDAQQMGRLWDSLRQHADYLSRDENIVFHNNHGLYQAAGQWALGRRFGTVEALMAQAHMQGAARFSRMLASQFTEEGIHREHSPAYHRMVCETLKGVLGAGLVDDPATVRKIRLIESNLAWFVMPNGRLANFGDSDRKRMREPPEQAIRNWRTPEMMAACSLGEVGKAPEATIKAFEKSGYFIARDRWPASAAEASACTYLAQTAGFHSRTHRQADDLSFIWYDRGSDILVDAGRYGYIGKTRKGSDLWNEGFWYSNPYRIYCETTRAHNTMEIDGRNNPRRGVVPYGSAIRSHGAGRGGVVFCETEIKLFGSVRFARVLAWLPGNWLLVFDCLHDNQEALHDYRQWFHLGPDLTLEKQGAGYVCMLPQSTQPLRIAGLLGDASAGDPCIGQEKPSLQGFYSPSERTMKPNWAFAYEQAGRRSAVFATLFAFADELETTPEWSKTNASGRNARLRWSDGVRTHTITLERPEAGAVHVDYGARPMNPLRKTGSGEAPPRPGDRGG